jgi:hypothetical protein
MTTTRFGLAIVVAVCLCLPACLVPPFSSLQDARMAGPGNIEMTPFYSSIGASGGGGTQHLQDDFGVQALLGVAKRVDLGFRYEYFRHPDSGDEYDDGYGAHVIAFGPNFSLVKDALALALPVGFATGEGIKIRETWQFQPTLIATLPLDKSLDVSVSGKALIPFQKGSVTMYALDFGFAIRPMTGRVTFRPEAGFLFSSGGSGFDFHLSLGLSFRFGKGTKPVIRG